MISLTYRYKYKDEEKELIKSNIIHAMYMYINNYSTVTVHEYIRVYDKVYVHVHNVHVNKLTLAVAGMTAVRSILSSQLAQIPPTF